jgi:hypothetical protein
MPGETKKGMSCSEFEGLLGEVIEEGAHGPAREAFQAHAAGCPVCGPLLTESKEGYRWLKSLAEVEPPANLVHNILAATSGVQETHLQAGGAASLWEWLQVSVVAPAIAIAKQPRFAMSFGMAFFSLSVGLNVAGVKITDVRHVDLRPSAIRRTYYETSGKIDKYYENLRFVYELESRMRELKRISQPEEQPPHKEKDRKNNTSGQPEQNQQRNYIQQGDQPIVASLSQAVPVVPVTAHRRFV